MSLTYVSPDGNYGDATGLVIVDTSKWTEDDWDKLDYASDWDKPKVAVAIEVASKSREVPQMVDYNTAVEFAQDYLPTQEEE